MVTRRPSGPSSPRIKARAGTGAWFGGLFGLMVGAAALLVPGVGPMVVAGPLAAAVLAGLEGAPAGTAPGGRSIPKERALTYETHIQGSKFLVMVRGSPGPSSGLEVSSPTRTTVRSTCTSYEKSPP